VGSSTTVTVSAGESTGFNFGNNAGGLIGRASGLYPVRNTTVSDSHAMGSVASTRGNAIGGLVGNASSDSRLSPAMTIQNSFAAGSVSTGDGQRAGGLVGQTSNVVITSSYATGSVTGNNYSGGLVGEADGATSVADSYATGSVVGSNWVAGLIGNISNAAGSVSRSYARGPVTGGASATEVGGLVGEVRMNSSSVLGSFWDTVTTGQPASAGEPGAQGAVTTRMTSISTFREASTPWAIVAGGVGQSGDVWGICPEVNDGYPFLLWQTSAADCQSTGSTQQVPVPSFFAPSGVLPQVSPGLGEWVQADGSSTSLVVSSPGPNQVRYTAEGVQVTFTGGAGSDASRGLIANPNGEIVCEVCIPLAPGQVIEVWMFSTPRLVAAHLTQDLPCQRFTIPVGAPLDGGGPVSAGAHTLQLALPTASGMQAVNVGMTVGGPVPASVPAGEGPTVPVGLLAFGLLVAAGAAAVARRQVVTG
jgi:hypothetical protein